MSPVMGCVSRSRPTSARFTVVSAHKKSRKFCVSFMASIHYDSMYSKSRSGYTTVSRSGSCASTLTAKPESNVSMMSGLKSIFCSKQPHTSSSHAYYSTRPSPPAPLGSERFKPLPSASPYQSVRTGFVKVRTSESCPILSPQLEDRLLQLADRSRRLGVHRFSRTRNALILNEPVQRLESRLQTSVKRVCHPSNSNSSLSTRSSVQKLSLSATQVRE